MVCHHVQHVFFLCSRFANVGEQSERSDWNQRWEEVDFRVRPSVGTSSSPSASLVFTASCLSLLTLNVNTAHNASGQRGTLRRVSLGASFGNTRKLSGAETFEKDIRTRQKIPFSFLSGCVYLLTN